jgi:23S rRNA (pseudouridine1915-N3)-methyltransferase
MNVVILGVGKARGPLAQAISLYEDRAARYWKLQAHTVDSGAARGAPPQAVREEEGKRILRQLPESGEIVALTRAGKTVASEDLATFLQEAALRSTPSVTFVVGGAFGLARSVIERATRTMSLSGMTLPHDLARLVLAEQLYRAGTILRNEPYHKGTAR